MSNSGGTITFHNAVFVLKESYARIKPLSPVDINGLVTIVLDTASATFVFQGPDAPDTLSNLPPNL